MFAAPVKDYTLEEIQESRMELRNDLKELEKIVSSELVPGWKLQTYKAPDGSMKGIYWDDIATDIKECFELSLTALDALNKIEKRLLENRRTVRSFCNFIMSIPDSPSSELD